MRSRNHHYGVAFFNFELAHFALYELKHFWCQ
jgi:hypothetical protein